METKKVKQVRENIKNYPTKLGATNFVHGITLEGDAQEWEYHSVSDKCVKFIPGVEATFTTEVKQNGSYTNYKISPINPDGAKKFVGGGGFKQEPKDQGAITALSIYSSTMVGFQGSVDVKDWSKVLERCELAWAWVKSKSDNK